MKFLHLAFILSAVCLANAFPQDESEPRAVPQRGLLKRGLLTKGKQTTTTTTTTPAPQEDAEYDDDAEYPAEGEEVKEPSTEAPPSSTEGKKLVAGGVRPFRSNNDLLEALKRRRAQAAEAKAHGHSSTTAAFQDATEAPAKSNFTKKRGPPPRESNNEDAFAPTKPSRARFGRPSSKSIRPEIEVEEQIAESAPQPRNARTFSRRGGN